MSTSLKPLSRRAFLRGSGGILVGLPFLEAMIPSLASAATSVPRLVSVYGGVPSYFGKQTLPIGALGSTLIPSVASLASVRQHVSVITSMALPIYAKGTTPPPGGAVQQQHHTAMAPSLAGVASYNGRPSFIGGHTIDQVVADTVGTGTRLKSVQARVQAVGYIYGDTGGIISARTENGVTNLQYPTVSPLALFNKIFSAGIPSPAGGPASPAPSAQVLNRRSVLDLVLGDATKLSSKLSGSDKARLDQHFDQIREIEKSLSTTTTPSGGASASCALPSPPTDPATGANILGGWSSETIRGDLMADIIALALACDLTRAVAWQLTYDQCGLGSDNISGVHNDLHAISHDVGNDPSLQTPMMQHYDWHCARFARLVGKLASLQDGAGTVLDNTFLAMSTGEGVSAHNRSNMHVLVAGCGSKIKLGQCIAGNSEHIAKVYIAGMNAIGINKNTLGEISGPLSSILK